MFRSHPCIYVACINNGVKLFVSHIINHGPGDDLTITFNETDFMGNGSCCEFVVAGYHDWTNSRLCACSHRFKNLIARWVEHSLKPNKYKVLLYLLGVPIGNLVIEVSVGESQNPKGFRSETGGYFEDALTLSLIQWSNSAILVDVTTER